MKKVKIKNRNEEYTIGKVVCVGRNYAAHARELGNEVPDKPVLFLKPPSAIIYSGGQIKHPFFSNDLHHEAELVLLIGTAVSNADEKQAEEAIAGFSIGLDMTLRDVQNEAKKQGNPWTIAKCFDTSCVLTDFVSSKDYKLTMNEEISLFVNDVRKQNEKLNMMLFPPVQLVQYISSLMVLEEGDLIMTGTPSGVSKVNRGDKLFASITDVAELECSVV